MPVSRPIVAAAVLAMAWVGPNEHAPTSGLGALPAPARETQAVFAGVIDGQVVEASTGLPVRRARVSATSGNRQFGGVYTDAQGHYQIDNLAAGRYVVIASKSPYLEMAHGQARPEDSAEPAVVGVGETVRNVDVMLVPGGVIAGRLVDERGGPVAYAEVAAWRSTFVHQQRTWTWMQRSTRTDDRGRYRIFGLEPAEYLVSGTYQP